MHFIKNKFLRTSFQLAVIFAIGIWICVPLLMYIFPAIGVKIIFFNNYYCPLYTDLKNFELFGLPGKYSRNFYVTNIKENLKLGFWHLLPEKNRIGDPTAADMEAMLSKGDTVILYLHGNALNRGGHHMVHLYKHLTSLNYHIVSLDYRGYGDSEGTPWTEDNIVADAMTAWDYVKQVTRGKSPIYVWGHSLGTGVSTKLLRILSERKEVPQGLILESPYTSMKEGIRYHPLSRFYRSMPYFHEVFVKNAEKNDVYFNTVDNVLFVDCPILILHSKDDHVLPYHFSETIEKVLKERQKDVKLHLFPAGQKYFHKDLWKAPELKSIIQDFVAKTKPSKSKT